MNLGAMASLFDHRCTTNIRALPSARRHKINLHIAHRRPKHIVTMPANNKIQDLFNVQGLVAVITGGGSGLGSYAARALDANGAKAVYIVGRREEVLQEAAKTGVNGSIKPIVGDVSDKASLTKIVEQIRQDQYANHLGRITPMTCADLYSLP